MLSIDEYIKLLLDEPFNNLMKKLDSFDDMLAKYKDERPTELKGFKEHLAKVERFKTNIESQGFDLTLDVVLAKIIDDIQAEKDAFLQSQENRYAEIDRQIEELKLSIENDNRAHNERLRSDNANVNVNFNLLESKRKELESHSDKIFDVCSQYGITSGDVSLDESLFTPEELCSLYDEYLKFVEKEEKGSNPITWFRNHVTSTEGQGIILGIVIYLCLTSVLDYISIVFFALLIYNQISSINKVKYYSILMAVTFNVKPENMGYVELDSNLLLPEELTDEILDTDERFSVFEQLYDDIEREMLDSEVETLQVTYMNEWASRKTELDSYLDSFRVKHDNKLQAIIADVNAELNYLRDLHKKLKDAWKFIGERYTDSFVFNNTFSLGLHDECIEETIDIGNRNIIIRPSIDSNLMTKFIQTLYANAISNIAPGKISFEIYDPNDMGEPLLPFFMQDLSNYMFFHKADLKQVIDDLTDYVQSNLQLMRGSTIAEYNAEAELSGITPISYRVLIILSQPKTVEEDEALNSFFEYSMNGGVFIWLISDIMQSKSAFTFRRPFEGIDNPIIDIVNREWCQNIARCNLKAIESAKPKGLPWEDFIENVVPDSKMWIDVTDNAMDLYPGYENGDPSAHRAFTVGNEGNVHVIGVGGTGAGKSVFLNHIIATATQQYSPSELELWLCDFKGTEFKFYLPNAECPYMIPHIKACLCTSDGDYATSLFKALRDVADKRYEILKDPNLYRSEIPYLPDDSPIPNQKGTVGWNKYWRGKAESSGDDGYLKNIWPRILFICDEFQVIFEKASDKNVEQIKADITQIAKVGRAANVHIFFASQSMKKTLSADILQQFTLRFALRCDKEVSQEILGTTKASDIKEKFGFLIVTATGIEKEKQPKYKTPFIADKVLRNHIKKLAEKAQSEHYAQKDVITYEEVTKHPIEELVATYNNPAVKSKLPDSGVFFLGNRMAYSTNKAPDNIILGQQNNTNIMSCFGDYSDFVMFFNQMVVNIKNNKNPGTIIVQSQIDDLAYIVNAEENISRPDLHTKFISSKITPKEFVKWCSKVFEKRKSENKKDSPIWIFLLGWEVGKGIGVEPDMNLRSDFVALMKTAGEFDIHFIFMCNTVKGISSAIFDACKYRIAGKCSQDDSIAVINTKQAGMNYDLKTGWLFSAHDGTVTRDKLYISPITREIQSTEIVV